MDSRSIHTSVVTCLMKRLVGELGKQKRNGTIFSIDQVMNVIKSIDDVKLTGLTKSCAERIESEMQTGNTNGCLFCEHAPQVKTVKLSGTQRRKIEIKYGTHQVATAIF